MLLHRSARAGREVSVAIQLRCEERQPSYPAVKHPERCLLFYCRGCRLYQPYCCGACDGTPELCDVCANARAAS